jgi:hypothetical protein
MGSQGIPIRIRRTNTNVPLGNKYIGEMFLHYTDKKFGIYDGTNMLWYPTIDPITNKLVLGVGQKLSGKDSNSDSNIDIDFNQPNAVRIIHRPTNTQLAEFSSVGSSFANLVSSVQNPGGYYNKFTHPGFTRSHFSTVTQSTSIKQHTWLGPNTLMWKKLGATGNIICNQSGLAGMGTVTHPASEDYCLKIDASSGPTNGVGVRGWIFEAATHTSLIGVLRCYLTFNGPIGQTIQMRVGRSGVYVSKTVTGTGNPSREFIDVPSHSVGRFGLDTDEPYAWDFAYNPSGGVWHINEPTIQPVDVSASELYQFTSIQTRNAIASMYYWTPHFFAMKNSEIEYVTLPIPVPIYNTSAARYDVDIIQTDNPVAISNSQREGFEITPIGLVTGNWKTKVRVAYRGSLTDIS